MRYGDRVDPTTPQHWTTRSAHGSAHSLRVQKRFATVVSISHLGEKDEYRGGTELLGMRALDVVPVTEDACAPIAPNSEVCAAESLSDRGAADDCGAECDVRLGNDTSALLTCPAVVASPCADRVHEWPERRCARSFFKPTARACTLTGHSIVLLLAQQRALRI